MENLKIEISKDELENGIVLGNHVLCEAFYSSEGAKTASGVIVGFLNEVTYASEDGKDTSSHPADMAETCMRVARVPQELYFNPQDPKSMDWETEMELIEDDLIWTNPIDASNCITLICEGKEYKLVNYQDIYCYKREIWLDKWSVPQKKRTIVGCLNGYVLLSQVNKDKLSDLDITSDDKIDPTRGIVRFIGTPNKRYRFPEIMDMIDLRVGDGVLFDRRAVPFLLERQKYNARFDDKMLYWVVPRNKIAIVLKRKI